MACALLCSFRDKVADGAAAPGAPVALQSVGGWAKSDG